ncbi:HEAT repeat domain-containing protein [Listeria cornellensis]|uniref:HEAT repeat-containing PBS lyase n=1 Tax=Listeria cornellensis FSL F6-0969 TaxID=1265820 RepID=W7BZP4_9LIST|nr:HEAT repeat domain-containing protein [Listeria cornellensis]EUJ32674.1 HEAT repeat-containing PBS lyase [Listeria cornellensis FSL F6-0969]
MKHWYGWEKMNSEVENFKLWRLNTIKKFTHELLELPPYFEQKPCLTTQFLYWTKERKAYDLEIRFIGVSSMKLDMFGEGYAGDIRIQPESIEDIQFYVEDYEDGSISFYCEAIEYLGMQENIEENFKHVLREWNRLAGMLEPAHAELDETLEILVDFIDRPVVANILLEGVTHENSDIRDSAYEYLWYLDDPRAFDIACAGLKNEDVLRRINCLEYLGRWGNTTIIPQILDMLENDEDPLVRCYAAEVIGYNEDEKMIPILQRLLQAEQDDVARIGILYALELSGHPELERIFDSLKNEYYIVRIRAVLYLTGIAWNNPAVFDSIVTILQEYRELEETVAAREAFDHALEELVG